jgi:hypothetical protein
LPLRDELYLLAHDYDTGSPKVHTASLGAGLAGAALIDLLLHQRVSLLDERIQVRDIATRNDSIADAAMAAIRTGPVLPYVGPWLRQFGEADLYERIRANLLAVGILRRQPRRMRADVYPPVDTVWSVRVQGYIRSVLYGYDQPDAQCAALCGLTDALGLHDCLSLAEPVASIRHGLQVVAAAHMPAVRCVIAAVADVVGDLATAVYR